MNNSSLSNITILRETQLYSIVRHAKMALSLINCVYETLQYNPSATDKGYCVSQTTHKTSIRITRASPSVLLGVLQHTSHLSNTNVFHHIRFFTHAFCWFIDTKCLRSTHSLANSELDNYAVRSTKCRHADLKQRY